MSSPETAGANTPSLSRDWLFALRYWLRDRRGVAALVVSTVVIGGALNWSWLVAAGIAPLLITVLPCAVMCALGLCMNKMGGRSCSTSSGTPDHAGTPMPNTVQRTTVSRPGKQDPVSVAPEPDALPDHSTVGAVEPAPEEQPQVLKERE